MENEKVKEIKKVLEEYIRQYSNFKGAELCKNALTLINELESENERLVKELEDMPVPFMRCMLENQLLSDISTEKNGEIKALKDQISELKKKNARLNKALVDNLEAYKDGFNEGAILRNKIDDKSKIALTNEIFADILNEENIETVYFTFDGNIRDKKVISLDTITTLARERGVEVKDIKYGK